ncbi:MAG: membrane protein insertase YidC [Candidatus Dependentiae bacterium]
MKKINDLIVPLTLAFIVSLGIQYYMGNKNNSTSQPEIVSGQGFTATPSAAINTKPLLKEVDFIDESLKPLSQQQIVETDHAIYTFSTGGASLEKFTFKRPYHGTADLINTIQTPETQQESRAFLVAFEQPSPYSYSLMDRKDSDVTTQLTYQADFENGSVIKKFIIHHNSFQIDLMLTVIPHGDKTLTPRIFLPSPEVIELKDDTISTVMNNEKNAIVTEQISKLSEQQGWFAPTLFGSQDRYFVHAMVSNPDLFVKRAYYKASASKQLITILEGPETSSEKSWMVSFYVGPKESKALAAVDSRLEKTLGYTGILAPISKALLVVLNFLYRYLHNYGLAIIILTLSLNLILLPLRKRGNEQMKKTAELQRKLAYVQQKYKNDPEALAREKAELFKKYGTGLGGCLPNLILLPVFFALSPVLSQAIELYKAPFFGWIKDLSARDPYYILPLLIFVIFIIRALFAETNQRFSMLAVALIFGAFAANFSAGLCLYILVGVLMELKNIRKK